MSNQEPNNFAWQPTREVIDRSRILSFMKQHGFEGEDRAGYEAFNRRAIADPEWYYREAIADLGVEFLSPFSRVRDESKGKQHPQWFVDGKINIAHLAAIRHAEGPLASKEAVVYEGDSGQRRSLTYAQLATEVRHLAANLTRLGVTRGDRVLLFMPVVPEAAVAFLAVSYLGAISVPTFSGYAPDAIATRLRESEAVAMITADGTTRRGGVVDLKRTADEALKSAPTVKSVIVVRHLGSDVPMQDGRDVYYDELDISAPPVDLVETDANDPYTIIYTSGTTGKPKGIILSQGGFAMKTASDFGYGYDVTSDDVVGWISDLGWLVGPKMVTGPLQLGATMVMIEGVPTYPEPNRLWQVIERNKITIQGVAPTGVRALKAAGGEALNMPSLRAFISSGEAADEPTWRWLFEKVGHGKRPIINFTGGTEVGGGILISYAFLPSPPAAFTAALPGVDADVFDEIGKPVVGQVGELVLRNTFPGQTHSFWKDDERYLDTYWGRWDGIWVHGDLAGVDDSGSWMLYGRSDDTMKISGRRVGPAEIEAALLRDDRIADVAVIGVDDPARGQRAVAFAVLREHEGVDLTDLQAAATRNVGKGFAPTIYVVRSLPKTKNGKVMRRMIRARFLGQDFGDTSAFDSATPIEDIPILNG